MRPRENARCNASPIKVPAERETSWKNRRIDIYSDWKLGVPHNFIFFRVLNFNRFDFPNFLVKDADLSVHRETNHCV
jgi:hypothetical protein